MDSIEALECALARPRPALVTDMATLDGDVLVLGAGGKLGPSLVKLAVAALQAAGSTARVHAVSRFGDDTVVVDLQQSGALVHRCDIANDDELAALPDVPNVVFLVGAKFGTTGREHLTWTTNVYLPGRVARRFPRSRIVALSTGNVYAHQPIGVGAGESSATRPVGEYAMSCLGREQIFRHASVETGTPVALLRLNYAVEMRYGVLVDVASAVWRGEAIDLGMGFVNVVWQGYANEVALRALLHAGSPPFVLNLTGPETVSVRRLAQTFGVLLGREPQLVGQEAPTALLSDATRCHELFGYPDVTLGALLSPTAEWIRVGRPLLGKPTKFGRRDGAF